MWLILNLLQRDAVATSHLAQGNTIEFDYGLSWRVLDDQHREQWHMLQEVCFSLFWARTSARIWSCYYCSPLHFWPCQFKCLSPLFRHLTLVFLGLLLSFFTGVQQQQNHSFKENGMKRTFHCTFDNPKYFLQLSICWRCWYENHLKPLERLLGSIIACLAKIFPSQWANGIGRKAPNRPQTNCDPGVSSFA